MLFTNSCDEFADNQVNLSYFSILWMRIQRNGKIHTFQPNKSVYVCAHSQQLDSYQVNVRRKDL